ncbi:hypothetical protein GPJ56_010689 [Histomonas meleagridis]|uniref:uncharacterized protein n=1 Tax=Histomonas meleagridis TaxID=135588 RepID=UPI003559BC23|nr:hypothetical protein GPJ56_010689 [Histomonas meleagridis]KAH0801021.1 hypothetical protein GO595_006056 [Histomonas meleagridis]
MASKISAFFIISLIIAIATYAFLNSNSIYIPKEILTFQIRNKRIHSTKTISGDFKPFADVAIPQDGEPPSPTFKYYQYLPNNSYKCIDRKPFRHLFARIFRKDITKEELSNPQILLVGRNTALGTAIREIFDQKGISYLGLKGINHLDFSSEDSYKILDLINITSVIIAYQPPLIRHTYSDGSLYMKHMINNYTKGLISYLNQKNISYVFCPTQPIFKETIDIVKSYKGNIIEMPFLIDSKGFKDLENPIMRAIRECNEVGYSNIDYSPYTKYQSITSNEAAEYILRYLHENHTNEHILIKGNSQLNIEESVNLALKSFGLDNCKVNFRKYSHDLSTTINNEYDKIQIIGNENANIETMIKNEYTNNKDIIMDQIEKHKNNTYISFTFAGRNDGYSKDFTFRIQTFLDTISYCIQMVPLVQIEIVLIDYATPRGNKLLHEILNITPYLHNKIRFVIVPPETHEMLEKKYNRKYAFFEVISKNMGIRRCKGKFVLATNSDILYSTELFEEFAAHQFNPYIIYRANRWNMLEDTFSKSFKSVDELIHSISDTWQILKLDMEFASQIYTNRFAIVDSFDAFAAKHGPRSPGDFQLISRRYWDALKGFNEIPCNPEVDSVFLAKPMKMIQGFMRMYTFPGLVHLYHERINLRRVPYYGRISAQRSYSCIGRCPTCRPYLDTENWGYPNETFQVVLK